MGIRKEKTHFFVWNYHKKIEFKELATATENFSEKYCIGSGGQGTVFKAVFPDGVAVKIEVKSTLTVIF